MRATLRKAKCAWERPAQKSHQAGVRESVEEKVETLRPPRHQQVSGRDWEGVLVHFIQSLIVEARSGRDSQTRAASTFLTEIGGIAGSLAPAGRQHRLNDSRTCENMRRILKPAQDMRGTWE